MTTGDLLELFDHLQMGLYIGWARTFGGHSTAQCFRAIACPVRLFDQARARPGGFGEGGDANADSQS